MIVIAVGLLLGLAVYLARAFWDDQNDIGENLLIACTVVVLTIVVLTSKTPNA